MSGGKIIVIGAGEALSPMDPLKGFSLDFKARAACSDNPFDILPRKIVDAIESGSSREEIIEMLLEVIAQQRSQLAEALARTPPSVILTNQEPTIPRT